MDTGFGYSVDGYELMDSAGRWWVTDTGSAHSPALAKRSVQLQVPGMNGVLDSGRETRESATLPLRVMVKSADPAVREQYWEAVKSLFTLRDTFTLTRTVGSVVRSTAAKLKSVSEPDFRPGAGTIVGVIVMTLLDGAFHGPEADVLRAFNADFAAVALPALAGNAAVEDWTIRVTGPATSVTFTDDASATGVGWGGTLAAGQYLFLRGVQARRSTVPTDWISGGTDVSGGVTVPPAGLLALTPRVDVSDVLVRSVKWSGVRVGSSAATEVTLRGRSAFV